MDIIEDARDAFNGFRKSYGMFSNVRTIITLAGKTNDPHLKEKAGHYGELLVLEATELNLGTCWVGGTFEKKNPIFKVADDETLVCVLTIGNVNEENTFKESIIYKLTLRKIKPLKDLYVSDAETPNWFIKGMEAVQKAPSAINRLPVKFEYKNGVVSASTPDTMVYDLIDLGIAKVHFSLTVGGHFELGNKGKFIKE
ncbi:nitroreductase family protein [Alkalicella caledoniensis]|uniref:Nitroreductase family protein n=1 Tax=Alkalicella caledoniensis TaxID=2731377 RepID=A0A7G9W5S0_ALKCA|nr:nitroreductase family protein [Alkalicella caledoniensis]QNO14032.1 nitroreductase family protein [Alkalicella caledoniensis]